METGPPRTVRILQLARIGILNVHSSRTRTAVNHSSRLGCKATAAVNLTPTTAQQGLLTTLCLVIEPQAMESINSAHSHCPKALNRACKLQVRALVKGLTKDSAKAFLVGLMAARRILELRSLRILDLALLAETLIW